ncbi:MAG TPA: S26 family signal peptidase [Planctomycetota bacterium]|nr:S26 family signal peptidase [Planctomycetota bacterium]
MNFIHEYAVEIVKNVLLLGLIFAAVYAGNSFSCTRVDAGFTYMKPRVDENAILLVDRRPARKGELQTEEIVCYTFTFPDHVAVRVGRVLALPGETFQIRDGQLVIDGRVRTTASIGGIRHYTVPPILVPRGHLLVMFDHSFGSQPLIDKQLVPFSEIQGRVVYAIGGGK